MSTASIPPIQIAGVNFDPSNTSLLDKVVDKLETAGISFDRRGNPKGDLDAITDFEQSEVQNLAPGFGGQPIDFTDAVRIAIKTNEQFRNALIARLKLRQSSIPQGKVHDGQVGSQDSVNTSAYEEIPAGDGAFADSSSSQQISLEEAISTAAQNLAGNGADHTKITEIESTLNETIQTILAFYAEKDQAKVAAKAKEVLTSEPQKLSDNLNHFLMTQTYTIFHQFLKPSKAARDGLATVLKNVAANNDSVEFCNKINALLEAIKNNNGNSTADARTTLDFINKNVDPNLKISDQNVATLIDFLEDTIKTNDHFKKTFKNFNLSFTDKKLIYRCQDHETITPECLAKMQEHAQGEYIELTVETDPQTNKQCLYGTMKKDPKSELEEVFIQVVKNKGVALRERTEDYRIQISTKKEKSNWEFWDNPIINALKKPIAGWIAAGSAALFMIFGMASKEGGKGLSIFGAFVSFLATLPSLITHFGDENKSEASNKTQSKKPKPEPANS